MNDPSYQRRNMASEGDGTLKKIQNYNSLKSFSPLVFLIFVLEIPNLYFCISCDEHFPKSGLPFLYVMWLLISQL